VLHDEAVRCGGVEFDRQRPIMSGVAGAGYDDTGGPNNIAAKSAGKGA
jgi:hypothetical protein